MSTDFAMICPVTQLPYTQGCDGRRRSCTIAGTTLSIVSYVLPGALLFLLALIWFLLAPGG